MWNSSGRSMSGSQMFVKWTSIYKISLACILKERFVILQWQVVSFSSFCRRLWKIARLHKIWFSALKNESNFWKLWTCTKYFLKILVGKKMKKMCSVHKQLYHLKPFNTAFDILSGSFCDFVRKVQWKLLFEIESKCWGNARHMKYVEQCVI